MTMCYVSVCQEHFSKKLTSIKNTYLQEATRKQFEAASISNIASSAEYKRGDDARPGESTAVEADVCVDGTQPLLSCDPTAAAAAVAAAGSKMNASLTSLKSGRNAKPLANKDKPTDTKSLQKAEKGPFTPIHTIHTIHTYMHTYLHTHIHTHGMVCVHMYVYAYYYIYSGLGHHAEFFRALNKLLLNTE